MLIDCSLLLLWRSLLEHLLGVCGGSIAVLSLVESRYTIDAGLYNGEIENQSLEVAPEWYSMLSLITNSL